MKRIKAAAVLILGVFAIFTLLLTSCATVSTSTRRPYSVIIDSIADSAVDLRGKTYVITSAMQNISDEDLQFKEFARYIQNILSRRGYKLVDNKEQADLLICLAYGIGDPQTTTSTHVAAPGYSYPIGYYWYSVPPITQTVQQTTYTRHLALAAYDLKTQTPSKLSQVWKTTLTSTGSNSNLRKVIPYMLACGASYFGTNAGHKELSIFDDPAGIAIKESWIGSLKE